MLYGLHVSLFKYCRKIFTIWGLQKIFSSTLCALIKKVVPRYFRFLLPPGELGQSGCNDAIGSPDEDTWQQIRQNKLLGQLRQMRPQDRNPNRPKIEARRNLIPHRKTKPIVQTILLGYVHAISECVSRVDLEL